MPKYKFILKDGTEKIFEMTKEQFENFYPMGGAWNCRLCSQCIFDCFGAKFVITPLKDFNMSDVKIMGEIE